MPESHDDHPIYTIAECPALTSDACVCDEGGTLVFLSVWGRDTAIQEFLARLTLKPGEDRSLRALRLFDQASNGFPVSFGSIEMLEKRMTRTFRRTLFGSIGHLWLFDKRCRFPDIANATALTVIPKQAPDRVERLWRATLATCPLPLLDHWRECVLSLLTSKGMLSPLPLTRGPLEGYRLALDVPALTDALSDLIRSDVLGVSPSQTDAAPLLQRAA